MEKVESSMIDAAEFDGSKLYIQFKTGRVYEYEGVDVEGYSAFMQSDSKGKYFHEHFAQIPAKRIK